MQMILKPKTKYLKSLDSKISIVLMSSYIVLSFQYFILITFTLSGTTTGSLIQLFSKIFVGLAYFYIFPAIFKRSLKLFVYIYLFAICIFLIHYILFPVNRIYIIELIFPVFFMAIPTFIYTLSINDYTNFKIIMAKSSYIIFFFCFIIGVQVFLGVKVIDTYSMALSYYMLVPTIIFLDNIFEKFSFRYLILIFISFFVILAYGSRGAFLSIIVFILFKVFNYNTILKVREFFMLITIIIIGVFTLLNINKLTETIYSLFLDIGIKSRTLLIFMNDKIYLSGRDELYNLIIKSISSSPVLGIGVAGDRYILGGAYAHNLFLEIIADFGIPIGFIISLTILILLGISISTKKASKYSLLAILISLGFVPMMFSGSYLEDIFFWVFLAYILKTALERIKLKKT